MGYKHSSDPNIIMYPSTNTRTTEDFEKSITFNKGYVWHTQFCSAGSYSYQITADNKYNGFDVYVAPSGSTYDGIKNGKDLYYPSCSANNMISYSHTCTVAAESSIFVYNHNDDPTNTTAGQLDVKIVDMNTRNLPNMTFNSQDSVYDPKMIDQIWGMFH